MDTTVDSKYVLVAMAWPYANGSLHLGHIASFIGADVLARYHRLRGDKVLFVSGTDCYGTPIAVEAAVQGVSPASIAERYHAEFEKTFFEGLHFSLDFYTKTTTPEHAKVVQDIFLDLHGKGYIYPKTEDALYSPSLKRFLPDRFVEGECPFCGFSDARGDQCDECGKLLDPISLKNPRVNPKILGDSGVVSDTSLEVRSSEQFYLKLSAFQKDLEQWVDAVSATWRVNAAQFTRGFLRQGLQDRAITRDTDWGVAVPLEGYEDKKIYVWFDAVIGYLSASQHHTELSGTPDAWRQWWCSDDAVHYYVHGKDNVPFHTIIFPAILKGVGDLHLPDNIFSSEYLQLEGRQFSTSRSFAVWTPDFLQSFDGELLRYFLLAQGPETSDVDFRWQEFGQLVNGELIGTFGNLVNRVCSFVAKEFPEGVSLPDTTDSASEQLLSETERAFEVVGEHIVSGRFREAFRSILRVAEVGNQFAHRAEPWKQVVSNRDRAEHDLATLLHSIYALAILIEPFLPETSRKILSFFQSDTSTPPVWRYPATLPRYMLSGVSPLFSKISDEEVAAQRVQLGIS